MADQIKITGRPELNMNQQGSPALAVLARQSSGGGALVAPSSNLQGLLKGLESFNPALQRWAQADQAEAVQEQAKADQLARQAAVDEGGAAAQKLDNPLGALTGDPAILPSSVPPAYDAEYRRAYGTALAQRAAIATKQAVVSQYEDAKNSPDFDLNSFLAKQRMEALQGVKDPMLQGRVGAHLAEVESSIRNDYTGLVIKRHEEARNATAFELTKGFTADKTPDDLAKQYSEWFLPQTTAIQIDKKQAASMFFGRLQTLSDSSGGRPELFDALDKPGPDGKSILAWNPQLLEQARSARAQAAAKRDHALHDATEVDRFRLDTALDAEVTNNPTGLTVDRLASLVGPNGLSAEKAAGIYHQAQLAAGKQALMSTMNADAEAGKLGFYKPEDQRKVLESTLGPVAQKMWDAAANGDAGSVAQLANQLTQTQSRYRSSVPVESLERLVETNVSALPSPEGPSATFKASAEIYKAMASDPKYRSLYFKDDTGKIMDAYVRRVAGGTDPKTAYDAAYKSVDPEVIAAAHKKASTPEYLTKITSAAVKWVDGSTWVPEFLGGNSRPENVSSLGIWAAGEVRQLLTDNPDLKDSDIKDHIQRKAQENFVLDTTSQLAVKVPPAFHSGNLQQAITEFSEAMGANLKASGSFPEGSTILYQPINDEGLMRVESWNGTRHMDQGTIHIKDLIVRSNAKNLMSPEEGTKVMAYRSAMKNGTELPQIDPALLAKADSVGLLKDNEMKKLQDMNTARVLQRLQQVPTLGFGAPTGDYTAPPKKGTILIDNKLTSVVALDLAFGPEDLNGLRNHGNAADPNAFAASLVAVREGVALRAYPDPAKGAGMNIGAGYNLKANAANANADLKRSGVPADRIEDVKAGKAQLTEDQAKRLLQVATERYAKSTKAVADSVAPGLWEKMLPQQRAVMTDLSYQTGDASQFKKAWAALVKGDTATFANEVKVTYVNQQGQRVEDKRGTDLRASMLAGSSHWKARVAGLGSVPSNPLMASLK